MKLPFLISIPHGGTELPDELKSRVCITDNDLFDDSDSFTQEIYESTDIVLSEV
ncbi:MAG: N-formylglutamate amidohydrolase, partial [Pseudomonadota bacterium]|nr:N-formylglutamate amidohydrolase [Pseudomonadota bacterium]